MEKAYALALWRIITKGTKQSDAVLAMHEKLKREGREALWPRIANAFARIAAHDHDRNSVTLSVADAAHRDSAHKEAAAAGLDVKDAKSHVDPTLIGGWRLEGREHLVDASYKKHLLAMYRAATRS